MKQFSHKTGFPRHGWRVHDRPAVTPGRNRADGTDAGGGGTARRGVGGEFDISPFATNLLDEKYDVFTSGHYSSGFESRQLGRPRHVRRATTAQLLPDKNSCRAQRTTITTRG